MPDLKIKNVDPELIARLDEIVKQKRYDDRSDLIRDILKKYAVFGDDYYTKELPETVNILIKDSLSEYPGKLTKLLEFALELANENTRLMQKIEQLFYTENENL